MTEEPGAGTASAASTARSTRLWRLVRVALHLLRGAAIAGLRFPFLSGARRRSEVRRWSGRLLDILAVRLHVRGAPSGDAGFPLMLVANHVSWLDIFVIDAVLPACFVAKSEVRSWPLIGWLCGRAGTLFIERARRHDTARVNQSIAAALRAGEPFAVFPEGTTTDGSAVLKFHSSLLQPALLAGATLWPVAIRFSHPDGSPCTEAAYDGDKSLWDTLRAIVTQPAIDAHIQFLAPLRVEERHRRDLALAARAAIATALRL